jgi:hypothetical protein
MKNQNKPYSVLLLLPDYVTSDYGGDTFYEWVRAQDAREAVEKARKRCMKSYHAINDSDHLVTLLVTEGHNARVQHG